MKIKIRPRMPKIKIGHSLLKIIKMLKKVLIYSWQASPITFVLLMIVSLLFCVIKFIEIKVFEDLIAAITVVYDGHDLRVLTMPLLTLGALLVLTPVIELFEYIIRGYFWRRGHGYMQALFHKRIGNKPLIDFENHKAFDQLKKASLGSSETPNNIRILVQTLFLYVPFFVVVGYYLFTVKPLLVLVLLLIFMPLLFAEVIKMNNNFDFENKVANIRRRIDYYEKCITDKTNLKETLQNNSFDYFYAKLMLAIHEFTKAHKMVYRTAFKIESQMNAVNILGYAGAIGLLVFYLFRGEIAIHEFAAIYYAVDKITSMLKCLISDLGEVMSELATTSFLVDFLEEESSIQLEQRLSKKEVLHLRDLSFYYPNTNKAAIKGVSLSIPVGTSLAIVGENGSGKSTLSKVIMGLYQPSTGSVYYGDHNLNDYSSTCKYQGVSAVFQDFTKYKLAVDENVRMSHAESDFDVSKVIAESNFNMTKLNAGVDTILSREFGGQDLSGGEWQRLAIARGLYRTHDVIVLDEPTAAIDPIEEEHVFNAFRKASQNKTSILVTHRLGSVQFADMIIVMDQGRLIEKGTHSELIALHGKYHQLFMSQAKWYKR